jgi:cardiolipin synthase
MHAKTLVVDSWLATVGSANMDMRSFHLNFELNAFVLGAPLADEMARQFRSDLKDAVEITQDDVRAFPLGKRLAYQTARLLSPLL